MTSAQMYQSNQHQDELTKLVCDYGPLVNRIAEQIKYKCPPGIELDDLIQCGIIGLLQAKNEYSPERGASFKTYATMKIRYAIYEGLRAHSGITRDIGQYMKKISTAIDCIEKANQMVSHLGIRENLGLTQTQYSRMNAEIKAHKALSMEDVNGEADLVEETLENPYTATLFSELKSKIKNAIKTQPKREQLILALYYNEFLSFKEIAGILQLTEARVSQIHHQLLNKLKTTLHGMEDVLEECGPMA